MRWLLLLTVILLPFLSPLGATSAEPSPRNQQSIECTAPEELIVHRDETAQTYITVHNQADRNQDITVQSLSVPEPLTTVGLPSNQVLVPNHLKQFPFGIRAAADAAYQNLTITFSVTSDMDPAINETVSLRVTIAPRSDLKFGVDDLASFTVDELVRTSVAVNITNNASYSDDISFSLYTSSSWVWGWTMADTDGAYAYSTVAPGGLSYVYLWVDVPAVTNGAPLAQTGPRFTLSAISGLDKAVTTWSFDLLMNEKKNVSIDAMESSLTLAPNQDGRVNAVVRNTGNTPNTLNITLQGLNPDETPLVGVPASDRFNSDGWVVALFGGLENVVLQPNESRFIEIGFQSPNEFQGEMHVELRVFAEGARADQRAARPLPSSSVFRRPRQRWTPNAAQPLLPAANARLKSACKTPVMPTPRWFCGNNPPPVVLTSSCPRQVSFCNRVNAKPSRPSFLEHPWMSRRTALVRPPSK